MFCRFAQHRDGAPSNVSPEFLAKCEHGRMVPVIDVSRSERTVARELDDVCTDVGFFQITGHGFDDGLLEQTWSIVRAFFDLPLPERLDAARPRPDYPFGYVPIAGETLSNSLGDGGLPDLKEIFNMGPVRRDPRTLADADEELLLSPNLWPGSLPELQPILEDYFLAMESLSARLLHLSAIGLGLESDFFTKRIDCGTSALRALNYPSQERESLPGQLRAGAHTDYGTLTILRQDAAPGGLEVLDHSRSWMPVPSVDGAFVINVGDMLAQWTNDRWRSTLHRVVNPEVGAPARRQSIAFFHNANFDCEVACLPTCTSPTNPPRYAPVKAGPHLVSKFRRTG